MAGKPARTTDAVWRFWTEFEKAAKVAGDPVVFAGTYANKPGYHNYRNNLPATDYSVQRAADKVGPGDMTAALDITFDDARAGRYGTIAKYSKRLHSAGTHRDKRMYDSDGQTAILREYFGNLNDDRTVDGWSWFREREVTSDSSHLWHIHLSFTRKYLNDWAKLAPILDVLLGRSSTPIPAPPPAPKPTPKPVPEDPMANPARLVQVKGQDAVYAVTLSGAVHIKNPTHLTHLRESGQVAWPPKEITAAALAQLLEKE